LNKKKKVLIFTLPSVIVEVSTESQISDLGTDDTARWFVALRWRTVEEERN
jgi:hypothetical protein